MIRRCPERSRDPNGSTRHRRIKAVPNAAEGPEGLLRRVVLKLDTGEMKARHDARVKFLELSPARKLVTVFLLYLHDRSSVRAGARVRRSLFVRGPRGEVNVQPWTVAIVATYASGSR